MLEIVIMPSGVLLAVLPEGVLIEISAVGLLSTEQSRVASSRGRKVTVVFSALNRGGSEMNRVQAGQEYVEHNESCTYILSLFPTHK